MPFVSMPKGGGKGNSLYTKMLAYASMEEMVCAAEI